MTTLDELKRTMKEKLPELDVIIAWGQGFDPLHATPLFIRDADQVEQAVWNPLCVHNLATYLPWLKDKRVGVLVKGCDSRSVVQLLQEGLIDRDRLTVFGLPCSGVLDLSKVAERMPDDLGLVREVDLQQDQVKITTAKRTHTLEKRDLLPTKCLVCQYPNPVIADHVFGEERHPADPEQGRYFDLEEMEERSLQERMEYWKQELDRCIRCYACRNACPLCVCQDHCIAQTRDPNWLRQEDTVREKLMFQMIHAMHLAGRCTECGECERACPMGIPVFTFKRQLNRELQELFGYQAGTDPTAVPPLMTFRVDEENIKDRGW